MFLVLEISEPSFHYLFLEVVFRAAELGSFVP